MPWAHVKEIPNTPFLLTLSHMFLACANFKLFDVTNKSKVKSVFFIRRSCWRWLIEFLYKIEFFSSLSENSWSNKCDGLLLYSSFYVYFLVRVSYILCLKVLWVFLLETGEAVQLAYLYYEKQNDILNVKVIELPTEFQWFERNEN